jgi:copper chaperone CopZ
VRVALKGVNGVDSVQVSLNQGLATLTLKDGNTVTMKQLQDAIAKNGFTTKQANVVAVGQLISKADKLMLHVSGSNEEFPLQTAAGAGKVDDHLMGKVVSIVGTIPDAKKGTSPLELQFRSIEERK